MEAGWILLFGIVFDEINFFDGISGVSNSSNLFQYLLRLILADLTSLRESLGFRGWKIK